MYVVQVLDMLLNGIALVLAIKAKSEFGTRQLLREYETDYYDGYGKALVLRVLPLLGPQERDWLRGLY
jgi:hypothetical protein